MKAPKQQVLMALYMVVVFCVIIAMLVYIKHHPSAGPGGPVPRESR